MKTVIKFLEEDEALRELLPEIVKAKRLLQTVPVTTATAEKSFGGLRRLKSQDSQVVLAVNNVSE